jgi:hypothetical protein
MSANANASTEVPLTLVLLLVTQKQNTIKICLIFKPLFIFAIITVENCEDVLHCIFHIVTFKNVERKHSLD